MRLKLLLTNLQTVGSFFSNLLVKWNCILKQYRLILSGYELGISKTRLSAKTGIRCATKTLSIYMYYIILHRIVERISVTLKIHYSIDSNAFQIVKCPYLVTFFAVILIFIKYFAVTVSPRFSFQCHSFSLTDPTVSTDNIIMNDQPTES